MIRHLLWLTALRLAYTYLPLTAAQEAPAIRTFSYLGGSYVDSGSGKGEHVFRNQMYVEKLVPVNTTQRGHARSAKPYPVVLIHGQGQTGTNFLNKPDGGRSWTTNFLEAGYTVYIVDQTLRARSSWLSGNGAIAPSNFSAEYVEQHFTAPELYNLWPQAKLHTQWPDNGTMGAPAFDAFYRSNVQYINNVTVQQTTVQAAGAELLDQIGTKVFLFGHSQGGTMPLLIADARPELVAGLILLEPIGPPFQNAVFDFAAVRPWGLADIPLNYTPPVTNPATDLVKQVYPTPDGNTDNSTIPCILQAETPAPRQLTNIASLPILLTTSEAGYHAAYDYCTVNFLKQAGASKTQHLQLGAAGLHGNGHMFFMEKNSDQIWDKIEAWLCDNAT